MKNKTHPLAPGGWEEFRFKVPYPHAGLPQQQHAAMAVDGKNMQLG